LPEVLAERLDADIGKKLMQPFTTLGAAAGTLRLLRSQLRPFRPRQNGANISV
jgi:hypothetical protein